MLILSLNYNRQMRTAKKNKAIRDQAKSLKDQVKSFVTFSLKKNINPSLFVSDRKRIASLKKDISKIYAKQSAQKSKIKTSAKKKNSKSQKQNQEKINKKHALNKNLFPFQAIKFKPKESDIYKINKESNERFISNNKQNLNEDINICSKLAFHPRIAKYVKQNNTNQKQNETKMQVHDILFHQAVKRIFCNLDIFSRGVISQSNINQRISESALYFLGTVFQKIKNQKLILNLKQFSKLCDQVYIASEKEDVKKFMQNIFDQNSQNFESQSIQEDSQSFRNIQKKKNDQGQMQLSILQQKITFKNKKTQFLNEAPLSFLNKQNSIISFRKQSNSNKDVDSLQYESAKFAFQNMTQSQNCNQQQKIIKSGNNHKMNNQYQSKQKMFRKQQLQNQDIKFGNIRKNRMDQINNLRNQIISDIKNIKQMTSQSNSSRPKSLIAFKPKTIQYPEFAKPLQDITNSSKLKLVRPLQDINNSRKVQLQQNNKEKYKFNGQYPSKSGSKWTCNSQKMVESYNDLQKVRQQFKEQKRIIQNNEKERQKYFQDQIKKINSLHSTKRTQNFDQVIKPYQNYQKNIQRLSKSINLNSNIQRTKKQISLMQSRVSSKNETDSQHKDKGLDKIQKLSCKIQEYLQKNILKMQKSKQVSGRTTLQIGKQINGQTIFI